MSRRRGSTMTEVSLRLSEDAVDQNGVARMVLLPTAPSYDDNATIAPWLDVPPTPPPKSPLRSFNFPKVSVTSLASTRQGSYSNGTRFTRNSESQSTLSIPARGSVDGDAESSRGNVYSISGSSTHSNELQKSKSSLTLNVISRLRGRSSKANLALSDSPTPENHPSLRPPEPPLPSSSFMGLSLKKDRKKKVAYAPPLTPPEKDPHVHPLDLNLDRMEDIVDFSRLNDFSSPSTDYGSQPDFVNPFTKAPVPPVATRKKAGYEGRRISPRTVVPPQSILGMVNGHERATSLSSAGPSGPDVAWTAPESWDVAQEREAEAVEAAAYSSSDESVGKGKTSGQVLPPLANDASMHARAKRRRPRSSHAERTTYKIKIYRSNGALHIITLPFECTVAKLNDELYSKLLRDHERKVQHRLYLDEGGRERLLGSHEKPANIVRRRLKLAGYAANDNLELMGNEDLPFLFKFCYKSQLLGPLDDDLDFETFDYVDLTGRGLRAIPVILHKNAEFIVSLKLTRNPMLEIPLDFIQSCSCLRDLRLSNMAMQKVPQSVQHSTTLHRLDVSSNRISDLEETYLDHIPSLMELAIQNNKLSVLPWHFARLRNLGTLNISNNRFATFPPVVLEMENLQILDLSFNSIKELPDNLGKLRRLKTLLLTGNQIGKFPDETCQLVNLDFLDCRRNSVSDLSIILSLPNIRKVSADHNAIHALELSMGPNLSTLDVSHNDITQLSLVPGRSPYSLTTLDLSYAKLSSLDDLALGTLASLQILHLDHNAFRAIPDSLGELAWLETLTCSDNLLDKLPSTIGRLQKLEVLDAHNNQIIELPQTLWLCASLTKINVTSNFLGGWQEPPVLEVSADDISASYHSHTNISLHMSRKGSTTSTASRNTLPPLVHSLEKLYLGENRLTDESILPLMMFKELRVLNLSFNEISELPSMFFRNMVHLEELYLSGNKLTSIPTEDLYRMKRLSTLYLNGNRLQTLPQELGKVKDLSILDVGSNLLKYNINNWEFDWNWNFNKKLKYLNLSGNNRLQIKAESSRTSSSQSRMSRDLTTLGRQSLAGFKELTSLRVLGLMDVTITTTGSEIPDESDLRRVRTSLSTVNGMAYGIADSLGRNDVLNMLDLVYESKGRPGEPSKAIFAMFGRSEPPRGLLPGTSPNKLPKYLHDHFIGVFLQQLGLLKRNDSTEDALRRTFLKLNQQLYLYLNQLRRKNSNVNGSVTTSSLTGSGFDPGLLRTGASSVVVYVVEKTVYVANVGDALAVISRQGVANRLSRRHDPYDRDETAHIRSAEGWITSAGLVNDESEVSRGFGQFNLVPVVNACPDVSTWNLNELDEFIIIANRGLWDYVPYQTAVDIARTVALVDPMIAAQKLRDFAISYGADGTTMIMVVVVGDLFRNFRELGPFVLPRKKPKKADFPIKANRYMEAEVDPPVGHLALVFTDIRNSTHLWEVNPGMSVAIRLHNNLLRKQLRRCGGYEVKTEGDAFMVSFPTSMAALWWCLTVQSELMKESWPLEILECEDGKEVRDDEGRLIARGLSIRMGIHSGFPLHYDMDQVTNRMDYLGPMVNRSARVSGQAQGGQIMVSGDVLREIQATIYKSEPETEYTKNQPQQAIDGIKDMGMVLVQVGEVKLKGLEFTEFMTAVYPRGLESRYTHVKDSSSTGSASRVQFSVPQTKALGHLCLRLEALSGERVFRRPPMRKGSIASQTQGENEDDAAAAAREKALNTYFTADPDVLLPRITEQSSDTDLMIVLDSLAVRIENAISAIADRFCPPKVDKAKFMALLMDGGELDAQTVAYISSLLNKA